jgi:hypothetical protein
MHVWYNSLKSDSIKGFNDLCAKLVAHFSTNIPTKWSSTKPFGITHWEQVHMGILEEV